MRYAIINEANEVVNFVEWDGNTEHWQPPPGTEAVPLADDQPCNYGWTWNEETETFSPAEP